MFPQTNPENAAIVDRLVVVLGTVPMNGTAAYTSLSATAGCDVSNKKRHLLDAARKKAETDLGCVFATVRSVGIKRLTAEDSIEIGPEAIRSVRRKSKAAAKRLDHLNSNSLPDASKKRAVAYSAMLKTIAMMADGNKARIVAAIVDPAKPIPPKDILAMFAED
jgi:hypothetical protein